jgi:hypothetical protein
MSQSTMTVGQTDPGSGTGGHARERRITLARTISFNHQTAFAAAFRQTRLCLAKLSMQI